MVTGIPHLNNVLAGGKSCQGVGVLPQTAGDNGTIRLNGVHSVIAVIVGSALVIDGQPAGFLQIKAVDRIFQRIVTAGCSNGNGAVGGISGCHVLDDDPQELHGNGNGPSDGGGFIRIPDIKDVVSHIQSGQFIGLLPLCVLVRSRDIFSGHRQQGKLVAASRLSGCYGRFAVINTAGDLGQVDLDLAIAVGGVDRLSLLIRGAGLCHLGDGDSAQRQNDGQRIDFHCTADALVSGLIRCGQNIAAAEGQDIAAREAVTALTGSEQFQVIERDAGDFGHLVAFACELFSGVNQRGTIGVFTESGHGRVGIPLIQVHEAVAGHTGAFVLDRGTVDATEDGIKGIHVGFTHVRRKVLTGGCFGIIILIVADSGRDGVILVIGHLQHDLHVAGNGSRNGCPVLLR